MTKRKANLPMLSLRAGFVPSTFNEDKRTVDVVWTTGARVKRFSFFEGPFFEELSLKREAVDLSRLNNGAPLLNNHNARELNDVIGVVESARITKGQGVATVRLSDREELAGIVKDIQNGIIRNISVGYRVNKYEERTKKGEDIPTLRAVDWTPMELSFVGIPADAMAQTRSEDMDTNEVIIEAIENQGDGTMRTKKRSEEEEKKLPESAPEVKEGESKPEEEKVESPEEAKEESKPEEESKEEESKEEGEDKRSEKVETAKVDAEQVRAQERERVFEIQKACRAAKLEDSFALKLITENKTVDEARKEIFRTLEDSNNNNPTNSQRVEVSDVDNKKLRQEAMVRGLLHRYDPKKYALKDGDREYCHDSIIDMARSYLQREMNMNDVLSIGRHEVAKRALHHSSDFPELLANTANKALRDAYEGAPNTFSPFTRETTARDFKEMSSIQIGDGGKLEKVLEHGEYKRSGIKEAAEKYKVEKYGKVIGGTWELMINDDLDAFTRIPQRLGVRAREKENEIIWGLIISNQIMAEDGVALFNAAHNNLEAAAAISVDEIGKGRTAMRTQVDLDGELINLNPRFLAVPAALETKAQQFVAQFQPDQAGNVNPFAGNLQVVVEPRLDADSATAWYLMADPSQIDMAELARLDGRGPEIFVREGFDVDGMETKIRYVFGARILDYRGFFKNPGA